jgi:hypothetical protein
MRTLVKITLETVAANAAIKSGELPKLIAATMERLKPEAAYFTTEDGRRMAFMVFDMKEPSDIPGIAEPWFMATNAKVEFCPVMTPEDVKSGLERAFG